MKNRIFKYCVALVVALVAGLIELPAVAEESRIFDILEYQIEGNTVLPTLAIERAVYPHIQDQFECKRNGAKPNFITFKTNISHERNLAEPYSLQEVAKKS